MTWVHSGTPIPDVPRPKGRIDVRQNDGVSVRADFIDPTEKTKCEYVQGGCRVNTCASPRVDAGPVKVRHQASSMTATHPAYEVRKPEDWMTGDPIDLTVAGAVFPGASGTVTPPPPVSGVTCSGAGCGTITPTTQVSWTPVPTGTVRVTLRAAGAPVVLICDFEAKVGSGTLPSGAVNLLPAPGGSGQAFLEVANVTSTLLQAGQEEIDFSAGSVSLSSRVMVAHP